MVVPFSGNMIALNPSMCGDDTQVKTTGSDAHFLFQRTTLILSEHYLPGSSCSVDGLIASIEAPFAQILLYQCACLYPHKSTRNYSFFPITFETKQSMNDHSVTPLYPYLLLKSNFLCTSLFFNPLYSIQSVAAYSLNQGFRNAVLRCFLAPFFRLVCYRLSD